MFCYDVLAFPEIGIVKCGLWFDIARLLIYTWVI